MIQILPVKDNHEGLKDDFFKGEEHFYTMAMEDGKQVMGKGTIFVKGQSAYLISLEIMDHSVAYTVFDSLLRSLMNLASHHGALVFNTNEENPLMSYFKKNAFDTLESFSPLEETYRRFQYYVAIEPFFARPCRR